jgi:hypothetical protein
MSVKVLALDLERTLVSDAMSAEPRPGLCDFLSFCLGQFERLVLFASVEEAEAREVLDQLARSGHVPPGLLARLEYVQWSGEFKDLRFVQGVATDEILLVDDDSGWVRPDQQTRWIAVSPWDGGTDRELLRVRSVLERWLEPPTGAALERSFADLDGTMSFQQQHEMKKLLAPGSVGSIDDWRRVKDLEFPRKSG